ncbi:hypothetical protein HDU85_003962 [Gaertneriomyces sp. JEL0708]|nr:hypothetical protein HDU85_003962 [Gaertneriomyces sp. JEL0708]
MVFFVIRPPVRSESCESVGTAHSIQYVPAIWERRPSPLKAINAILESDSEESEGPDFLGILALYEDSRGSYPDDDVADTYSIICYDGTVDIACEAEDETFAGPPTRRVRNSIGFRPLEEPIIFPRACDIPLPSSTRENRTEKLSLKKNTSTVRRLYKTITSKPTILRRRKTAPAPISARVYDPIKIAARRHTLAGLTTEAGRRKPIPDTSSLLLGVPEGEPARRHSVSERQEKRIPIKRRKSLETLCQTVKGLLGSRKNKKSRVSCQA